MFVRRQSASATRREIPQFRPAESIPHSDRPAHSIQPYGRVTCRRLPREVALNRFLLTTRLLLLVATTVGCDDRSAAPHGSATQPASADDNRLTIAAAADLKFAMDDLAARYHQSHPDVTLDIAYGSSGNFYAQLTNKAPFDLFFSADLDYPRQLADSGLGEKDSLFVYAVGRIVLWTPHDSKLDVARRGLEALLDPAAGKIAIANPQHAPYGRAARAALQKHHLWEPLQARLVLGENIAQAAQFVQSGSADAGIIARSLARAPQMKDRGAYYLIPPEDYPPLEQGGIILTNSNKKPAARQFAGFVGGPEGRAVLQTYGFALPGE